eukprot:10888825-Karenia_brevis.AAC.1
MTATAFSNSRLEGRALEHVLAGDKGLYVRMHVEKEDRWVNLRTAEAKSAKKYMEERGGALLAELSERGLSCLHGDRPVRLADADVRALSLQKNTISVDMVLWCSCLQGNALVEVKWGRGALSKTLEGARASMAKLKAGGMRGKWQAGRKAVKASAVGALAVSPKRWVLELESLDGRWIGSYSSEDPLPEPQPRKKQSGSSNWVEWRKGAAPGDKPLWPSGVSGKRKRS